ncbi:hypothetical protein GCM10008934_01820 [Virgibacillus salarius]
MLQKLHIFLLYDWTVPLFFLLYIGLSRSIVKLAKQGLIYFDNLTILNVTNENISELT